MTPGWADYPSLEPGGGKAARVWRNLLRAAIPARTHSRHRSRAMRVVILPTPDDAACHVIELIAGQLRENPRSVLGLATGGTMEPVYEGLIARHRAGLSFAEVTTFNLDEYVGLGPEHPQSYSHYMRERLFAHVDIAVSVDRKIGGVRTLVARSRREVRRIWRKRLKLNSPSGAIVPAVVGAAGAVAGKS